MTVRKLRDFVELKKNTTRFFDGNFVKFILCQVSEAEEKRIFIEGVGDMRLFWLFDRKKYYFQNLNSSKPELNEN